MIVHMIGNAHIDPVWLWDWQEGVDEVMATYASAAARCEEYPEFIFTRGEAWTYQQVERLDENLFNRIRKLVERGQWHITGGQWIQPDVNLPTDAGLRRQILHGRRYFKDRFGIEPDVGYNVDSFGHPATLPDLLTDFGYIGYVFHRPNQQQTPVPGATFRWRGTRGGEVTGFRIPAPYVTRSDDLYGQIMLSLDEADHDVGHVMCFYGVGNHGGGPTKGNIEYILENKNTFAGAELRFSTPQEFFREVHKKRERLPVVDFELQRTFPGCYVVMQDIKQEQRAGEHLLEQARRAITKWAEPTHRKRLTDKLDAAWEDLLFTEFHDILAGTSIPTAWRSVRAMQGRARINGEEIINEITRRWSRTQLPPVNHQQIVLINLSDSDFHGYVEHSPYIDFDAWNDRWLATPDGQVVPHQIVQAQSTIMLSQTVVFPATVKAGSSTVVIVREKPSPVKIETSSGALQATSEFVSNDQMRVDLSSRGISQISYAGQPLLSSDGIGLLLRDDHADTWGFKITSFDEKIVDHLKDCQWFVEESGPIRARVRTDARLGDSKLRWTLTMHRDQPELEIELAINFSERFKLLQMPIALGGHFKNWRGGLAGGGMERETGNVEWPVQGWAVAQPETGGQAALLSCCHDANSVSFFDNRLTWSLLRSTRMSWSGSDASHYVGRDTYTDGGERFFKFVLRPIVSPVPDDSQLHQIADRLVLPLVQLDRYEGMDRPPWGNFPPRRLWTPAEVRARKDGHRMDLDASGMGAVEE